MLEIDSFQVVRNETHAELWGSRWTPCLHSSINRHIHSGRTIYSPLMRATIILPKEEQAHAGELVIQPTDCLGSKLVVANQEFVQPFVRSGYRYGMKRAMIHMVGVWKGCTGDRLGCMLGHLHVIWALIQGARVVAGLPGLWARDLGQMRL
ncbi:uncharacterized protein B0I36DRAFT_338878, partial [Microdochium trichocladiopsis]